MEAHIKELKFEELALELLDFCGGDNPTSKDVEKWLVARGHNLNYTQRYAVLQLATAFLTNP